jgi:hypothetical protein
MRKLLIGTTIMAGVALASPAAAAFFTVMPGSKFAVPSNNDFAGSLAAAGLGAYTTVGASVTLSNAARVKFEYMGSESGNLDSFTAGSLAPFFENNKSVWGPTLIGYANFAGGAFTNVSFSSIGGVPTSLIGQDSFGIFLRSTRTQSLTSSVLYFGFDDQINNIDDNHDDFIVKVTAVPEPASWAMLIMGFSIVGMAARRRSIQQVTA